MTDDSTLVALYDRTLDAVVAALQPVPVAEAAALRAVYDLGVTEAGEGHPVEAIAFNEDGEWSPIDPGTADALLDYQRAVVGTLGRA